MISYSLGKRLARPGAVSFKFASYFHAPHLPVPPLRFGHYGVRGDWGMLANDRYGCCVLSGAAHETMVWNREGGGAALFDDASVLADYAAVAGFVPGDPSTDQGSDMSAAASYRRTTGVADAAGRRHKIDSYVALLPGDAGQLALAVYLTGAAGVGLRLTRSAEGLFDDQKPWGVMAGDVEEGGHYVPCVGRNSAGDFLVVSWGRLHAMTPEYYKAHCDEALAYVSLEALKNQLTPEGFSADQLRTNLAALAA